MPNRTATIVTVLAAGLLSVVTLAGCTSTAQSNGTISTSDTASAPAVTPTPEGCTALSDSGQRLHAEGTATLNTNGKAETYAVASGDATFAIADRFCIDWGMLMLLNPQIDCHGRPMQPGDILLLDADKEPTAECHNGS